jgi:glutamyl-tRNA synthetase
MVRTRFAPSPTGYLHIGGVRTALFNWLFARKNGGRFLLRIDDTDAERNLEHALQPILDGFRWLGIDWDEGPDVGGGHGPYFQSQRSGRYTEAVEALLAKGLAYRDYATADEIGAERDAARAEGGAFLYSRRWMADTEERRRAFEAEGRQGVVRLKMPRRGECRFTDLIRGDMSFEWAREQDHVIARADGSCLYHLASAVDDHAMEITHVIRAEEHLSNTPRQIFILEGLGWEPPAFAHLPFVAEPGSRNKLSKRKLEKYLKNPDFARVHAHGLAIAEAVGADTAPETFNPVIVGFYETVGYLPEAVLNYLLLLGWALDDRTEIFSREEMIRDFSLERVNKAAASFDPAKLFAFQERYMRELSAEERTRRALPYLERAGRVASPPSPAETRRAAQVVAAAEDRLKVAGDVLDLGEFFVADDALEWDEAAFEKRIRKPAEAAELLGGLRELLAAAEPFTAGPLEERVKGFAEARGVKIGQVMHPLRVAVTGKSVGIGMYETLEILGRESCLRRIDGAIARATNASGAR